MRKQQELTVQQQRDLMELELEQRELTVLEQQDLTVPEMHCAAISHSLPMDAGYRILDNVGTLHLFNRPTSVQRKNRDKNRYATIRLLCRERRRPCLTA